MSFAPGLTFCVSTAEQLYGATSASDTSVETDCEYGTAYMPPG